MSSYDIRPALRVDRLFQLLLATLADMAIEAIENSSWRRHLIHANRAFRSSYDVRLALRAKWLLQLKLNPSLAFSHVLSNRLLVQMQSHNSFM